MMAKRRMTKARQEASKALRRMVTVRYRAGGHARFQLPPALCGPGAAAVIEDALSGVEGVYRVVVYGGAGKLSVRWSETVCDFTTVARQLAAAIDLAILDAPEQGERQATGSIFDRLRDNEVVQAMRDRYARLRVRAEAVSNLIAVKTGQKPIPFDPKEWADAFVLDLVVFYLVKVHWERITTQWLPDPIRYRYQWLTVIYLTYRLVHYRKSRNKPKALTDQRVKK